MIRICAWCKKELGRDDREPIDLISHSMCQDCRDEYFPKAAAEAPCEPFHKCHSPRLVSDTSECHRKTAISGPKNKDFTQRFSGVAP